MYQLEREGSGKKNHYRLDGGGKEAREHSVAKFAAVQFQRGRARKKKRRRPRRLLNPAEWNQSCCWESGRAGARWAEQARAGVFPNFCLGGFVRDRFMPLASRPAERKRGRPRVPPRVSDPRSRRCPPPAEDGRGARRGSERPRRLGMRGGQLGAVA